MTDEAIIEAEVVEEAGAELVPAAPAHATLFRTDEPDLIIARATGVADALKKVLIDRQLISNIQGKEYVRVEGWTLTGTMLGVFPVCVWTRKIEDGWEARVEARTLSGAVVGAAEAMCVRSEKTWKNRDDYAIRSMAQTRATSKALRQPLDFVVRLAGFEATPAEEMPAGPVERRQDTDRSPEIPRSWAKVKEAVAVSANAKEAWKIFEAYIRAASYHLYGETDSKKLTADQRKVILQKAAGAAVALVSNDKLLPPFDGPPWFGVDEQGAAWASVLDGTALEIPDYKPPEKTPGEQEAESIDEEAARMAAEVFAEAGGEPS